MLRELLFILVLTLPTLQQDVLASSDDASTTVDSAGLDPSRDSSSPGGSGGNPSVTDWGFVERGETGAKTKTKWRTPSSQFQIFPKSYWTSYTIKFFTDCSQNSPIFTFATTGKNEVYLNGKFIQEGKPYPEYHTLTLKKSDLRCGCNVIKIIVRNMCCPSPCGLTFSLTQNKTGCYDCENKGITQYNRNTCQCECVDQPQCGNPLRKWQGYPTCGCKCQK